MTGFRPLAVFSVHWLPFRAFWAENDDLWKIREVLPEFLAVSSKNSVAEAANGELYLQRIESWIRDRETGVRNVNVLQSNADISIRA